MKQQLSKITKYLFLIILIIELKFEYNNQLEMIFITSLFLLPLLTLYVIFSIEGKLVKMHYLLILGIIFSWFGGIFLGLTPENINDTSLFGIPKNKNYFFAGVGGYLIAHLFFIASYFKSIKNKGEGFLKNNKLLLSPIIIYCVVILIILLPNIWANPEKQIAVFPVMIYTLVLSAMVAAALNRYKLVNSTSFKLVFIGSLFFLFSDSLIAINFLAFEGSVPKARFWINLTFMIAEFMIADGIIKTNYKPKVNS